MIVTEKSKTFKPVITNLLDNDLYKFTMHQATLHQAPSAFGKYRFKCRNDKNLLQFKDQIEEQLDHLCTLKFEQEDLEYLQTIGGGGVFTTDYINFLEDYTPKRRYIKVKEKNGKLDISFKGPIVQTMLFEIWVMAIVNEVYFRNQPMPDLNAAEIKLKEKVRKIKDYMGIDEGAVFTDDMFADMVSTREFKFADFGTRRRFSHEWQDHVVYTLTQNLPKDVFVGTSNVYFAKKYNIKPIGTFAHEWVQMWQGLGQCPVVDSQTMALNKWVEEYRGNLGIALSDTLGMDMFLADFDSFFGKLYDGVRHDSGDPFEFADKMCDHYESLGIDPRTKTIVFSDGLDVDKAIALAQYTKGRIKISFGIGTNLTNDVGLEPLQIVIKMILCGPDESNMNPVAKLSNDPSKTMCESQPYTDYLASVIAQKLKQLKR